MNELGECLASMAPAAARGPRSAQKRDGNGLLKDTTATERQRWTLQALQGYTVRAQVLQPASLIQLSEHVCTRSGAGAGAVDSKQ